MSLIKSTSENRWERIWLLAKIEFKLRYYENKLGLIWALIKPLTQLVIYFVAFKIIIRNTIPNFAIYLFTGIIIWQFFLESTNGLIVILRTKKYLYEYSNMSKIEIYLASLTSISLGFLFNLSILILVLLINQIGIGISILYLPVLFIILFGFCLGCSLILSNLYLIAKDINQVWPLVSQFLMWISPIFFSPDVLKNGIPFIEIINPMFGMISNFRNIILYDIPPNFGILGINTIQTLVVIGLGFLLLNKVGKKASEFL
jgi:ABC-type polysaccharide/polyol phosphate export permease